MIYSVVGSIIGAIVSGLLSTFITYHGTMKVLKTESKNNKRNNYVNNVIAHKVDNLDNFKILYSKFMSNCSKVNNIILNNDSDDLNELLKEIEIIKYQLQLNIDDSFTEYKKFMTHIEDYANYIQKSAERKDIVSNNKEVLVRMVFTYIFFENIWIERNLYDSENDMSKIYSEAEKRYNEIFSDKD